MESHCFPKDVFLNSQEGMDFSAALRSTGEPLSSQPHTYTNPPTPFFWAKEDDNI